MPWHSRHQSVSLSVQEPPDTSTCLLLFSSSLHFQPAQWTSGAPASHSEDHKDSFIQSRKRQCRGKSVLKAGCDEGSTLVVESSGTPNAPCCDILTKGAECCNCWVMGSLRAARAECPTDCCTSLSLHTVSTEKADGVIQSKAKRLRTWWPAVDVSESEVLKSFSVQWQDQMIVLAQAERKIQGFTLSSRLECSGAIMKSHSCSPGWIAMVQSWLTATSTSLVQAVQSCSPAPAFQVAGITGSCHHTWLIFAFLGEIFTML
ncbi:hypothetical protein AAY473_032022, partial [Plecturocebus cupreus]